MSRSSASQKLQALEQLRNGNLTRKVADAIGMSQSWVVRLRKEIARELERQKGGRPRHLIARERWRCVTLLTEGHLGVASKVAAEIRYESSKNVFDVIVRHALRWEGFACTCATKEAIVEKKICSGTCEVCL